MATYILIMEKLLTFLVCLYKVYIFLFLVIIILGFWYIKSNKVIKIKIGTFRKEIKRKKFLISLIKPVFVIPIIFLIIFFIYAHKLEDNKFEIQNKKLDLSEKYELHYDIIYDKYFLYGSYVGDISICGEIIDMKKLDNEVWIGRISDDYPYDNPVYNVITIGDDGNVIEEEEDKLWRENFIKKLEKTKGYFIIEKDKAVFGLSKKELKKRINKKVIFFNSAMYYLEKYGYDWLEKDKYKD